MLSGALGFMSHRSRWLGAPQLKIKMTDFACCFLSIVGTVFVLDARIVRVESGEILDAASASGTLDDFVSVEKELVEAILEEIEVTLSASDRRKIYVQTPTERFDAFASYGEGIAHRDEGRLDKAKKAFESALELDPEFEAARASLSDLRDVLASERSRHESERERRGEQASHGVRVYARPPACEAPPWPPHLQHVA